MTNLAKEMRAISSSKCDALFNKTLRSVLGAIRKRAEEGHVSASIDCKDLPEGCKSAVAHKLKDLGFTVQRTTNTWWVEW